MAGVGAESKRYFRAPAAAGDNPVDGKLPLGRGHCHRAALAGYRPCDSYVIDDPVFGQQPGLRPPAHAAASR
jgi:hypothetical protein